MTGKWIYTAVAATLGIMAALLNYHYLVLISIILFVLWIGRRGQYRTLLVLCIVILFFYSLLAKWVDLSNVSMLSGKEEHFIGEIVTIPKIDGNQLSFIYKLPSNEKLQLFYYIKSQTEKDELTGLKIGMTCELNGDLERPSKARNLNAFDYQDYLYKKRIHWIISPTNLSVQSCAASTSNRYFLEGWRSSQLKFIKEHFPAQTVGIVQALIFGERDEIHPDVEKNFQTFGIIHLLAISGLHVGLIVSILFYIFIRSGVTRERVFFLIILFLPIYMIITGAAPSVIRACMVTVLVLLSVKFSSVIVPLDAISFVYLLMLAFNPYYLTQVGFQLSFLISFALIISSTIILSHYSNRCLQMLSVTAIAQLCSAPVIFYFFYEISLLSLPFNLIMVPLVSVIILPLSFLTYIGYKFYIPLGDFVALFLSKLVSLVYASLEQIPTMATATLTLGRPNVAIITAFCIVIILILRRWESFTKLVIPIMLLMALIGLQMALPYMSKSGELTIIDVGQGDSVLLELPHRKAVYLIDTGGTLEFNKEEWQQRANNYEVGEDIILPLLKAKGIRSIDKLIISHEHVDHIGGALSLLHSSVKVKEIMIGEGPIEGATAIELIRVANWKGIPITRVKAGDYWVKDQYKFYILGPQNLQENENNRSVVIYALLAGSRWLFTGDLEEDGEQQLLAAYPQIKADVVKIGHHGSKTSTSEAFIKALNPKVALISVGKSNQFGHPNAEVLERLARYKVRIVRTDQNGSIRFRFNENNGTFHWMIPYNKDIE